MRPAPDRVSPARAPLVYAQLVRPNALGALVLLATLVACQSAPSPGASCVRQTDCASPLVCAYGRCRAECTQNRDCPPGASCLLVDGHTGACSLEIDTQCETGVGRACATGLVCAADRCQGSCATDTDCPSDGTCLHLATGAGFCFDTRGGTDGGFGDAGVDAALDAAPSDAGPPRLGALDVCLGTTGGCAIGDDRRVYCWGALAACGATVTMPTHVAGITQADAITCGDGFACAHDTNSQSVLCWGDGTMGQTGQGPSPMTCVGPTAVVDTSAAVLLVPPPVTLHAAGTHACVLGRDVSAVAYCWGVNRQVIDPLSLPSTVHTAVTPTFSADYTLLYSLALAPDGFCVRNEDTTVFPMAPSIHCAGENGHAELSHIAMPTDTVTIPWSADVVAGRAHRCALTASHGISCWGDAHLGQLGDDPSLSPSMCGADACDPTPHPIGVSLTFSAVAASGDGDTTCAILESGNASRVTCWGANESGQTGRPVSAFEIVSLPPPVVTIDGTTPLEHVRRIAVGPHLACAIDDQATLFCWGDTDFAPGTTAVPVASVVTLWGGQP